MTLPDQRLSEATLWLSQIQPERPMTLSLLAGDASFRRYFRAVDPAGSLILMDAPPSHEDCGPFLTIARQWRAMGVRVPEVKAADLDKGFLLLEDFGDRTLHIALKEERAESLYPACIDALVQMQQSIDGSTLPAYDEALLRREIALFPDWLTERYLALQMPPAARTELGDLTEYLVQTALAQPRVAVHRDYHSRNLMMLDAGSPGIIDFQDAVYGPYTYDLVSLLKDCYVRLTKDQREALVQRYLNQLPESARPDRPTLMKDFTTMGMQRHLKAAGIFARLWLRDGKAGYLPDIPNTVDYLIEALDELGGYPRFLDFLMSELKPALARKAIQNTQTAQVTP